MHPISILVAILSLPTLLLFRFTLRLLIRRSILSRSGLGQIPSPPLTRLESYTKGHNLIKLLIGTESSKTAEYINCMCRKLGKTFVLQSFLGVPTIMVTSAESIHYITVKRPADFIKPSILRNSLATLVGDNGIVLAEGKQHARLRRAVTPALHHDALMEVQESFFREGRALAETLLRAAVPNPDPDAECDAMGAIRVAAFSVIFKTCFEDGALSSEALHVLQEWYVECISEPAEFYVRRALLQAVFDFLPTHWFGYKEKLRWRVRETVADLCERERKGRLLELMVDESRVSIGKGEIVDTVLSFLVAGQATSSTSVWWTLYALAMHEDWQMRLAEELSGWSEEDGIDALDGLDILQRIVKESLRLYPPVTFTSRQAVAECSMDGFRVPAGAELRIPIMAVQRNCEVWGEDAGCFNPDRFLEAGIAERTRFVWCPFLFGVRGCIGRRFAVLEIACFVALVVKRCRVFVEGDGVPSSFGPFLTPSGARLRFEERR